MKKRIPLSEIMGDGLIALLVALIASINIVALFPGTMTPDSWNQFDQVLRGRYTDWHPPIVSRLWSTVLPYFSGGSGIFLLQQALYWSAIMILAQTITNHYDRRKALLVILVSLYPFFLYRNQIIIKDTFLATALLLAVALAFRREFASSTISRSAYGVAFGVALMVGMLARVNGVFAAGPLVLLLLPREHRARLSMTSILTFSIVLAIILLSISSRINYDLLKAERSDPAQSLQIFDIIGTAIFSSDEQVLAGYSVSLDEVRRCYTPYWWDTFAPWGICSAMRMRMGFDNNVDDPDAAIDFRTRQWINAVTTHPYAYIQHRAYHYNSSLYFLVPLYHDRYALGVTQSTLAERSNLEIVRQYLGRGLFISPLLWMILGLLSLYLCACAGKSAEELFLSKIVLTSGLLYGLAYFFIGVATEVRYYYWTMFAVAFSIAVAAVRCPAYWVANRTPLLRISLVLFLTIALGYTTRALDIELPGAQE